MYGQTEDAIKSNEKLLESKMVESLNQNRYQEASMKKNQKTIFNTWGKVIIMGLGSKRFF